MAKREYIRKAWEDRFNEPTADALRDDLHGQPRRLFDAIRRFLLQIDDIQEVCAWYGESWRWSIEYRLAVGGARRRRSRNGSVSDLGRCSTVRTEERTEIANLLAVLIPSPEDLQLAMRIETDLAEALPMRNLKRAVRDGLELASDPFDTRWGVWSIQYPALADDLKNLLKRKVDHLRRSERQDP